MLKKADQRGIRVFYAGVIALMLATFVWFAGDRLPESSVFLVVGAVYAFLVFRVVSRSFRAFTVMLWTGILNYLTLASLEVDGVLGIPGAVPWFFGFIVGATVGGYAWSGSGTGAGRRQFGPRKPDADDKFSGGWRLALINGLCALVVLGIGAIQLVLLSPTAPAVAVLVIALFGGWALFRFSLSLQVRNGLVIVGLPVVWFALAFVGGATDQMALPNASTYGALAGILIGGRYWSGPRLGEPRPPFNGSRRRRRRTRRPTQQKQTPKRE